MTSIATRSLEKKQFQVGSWQFMVHGRGNTCLADIAADSHVGPRFQYLNDRSDKFDFRIL